MSKVLIRFWTTIRHLRKECTVNTVYIGDGVLLTSPSRKEAGPGDGRMASLISAAEVAKVVKKHFAGPRKIQKIG